MQIPKAMSHNDKTATESRSPLKAAPLRYAGQSLDEEIRHILDDDFFPQIMGAIFISVLALHEWWRWYAQSPPQPILFTVLAVWAVAYTTRQGVLVKRRLTTLRLARDGERVVGQFLESLRESGYRVLHDIVGENFNIDHLLIGPKGIFTIETKTLSKPAKGDSTIDYDGTQILVNGFKPDRDPVIQAKSQAQWIKELVKELTGKTVIVRPAVVYPGWFINPMSKGARPEVWVLNPKALPAYIDHANDALSDEDIRSLTYHLSRYVRNSIS